ncbi:ferredoxin reductase family protein [Streptococcus rifensis]
MVKKSFWKNAFFPLMSLVIFATLFASMLTVRSGLPAKPLISFSSGLLAYSMMLTVTFMASRPRFIEKHIGLPKMYEIHALMAVVLCVTGLLHVILQWNGFANMFNIIDQSNLSTTGFIAVFSLILVMFTGIFSLSGVFVNHNAKLRAFKNKQNREVSLWIHRLAIVAIIAIYLHIFLLGFGGIFQWLITAYTVLFLGYYAYWKWSIASSDKYTVSVIERLRHDVWRLVLTPKNGKTKHYRPGDYLFVRMLDNALTREGHPFSTTSANTDQNMEFMIKEDGDWTGQLDKVTVGNAVTLEGPHGNYFPEQLDSEPVDSKPFVLLSGGIGVTPNLSIARHELAHNTQREIHFVWGLAIEKDIFLLQELEEIKAKNPNFSYHLIFSNETVEGYDQGFITSDYLAKIGADLFQTAEFFVCGPPPMLAAAQEMLAKEKVDPERIHIDEFGF